MDRDTKANHNPDWDYVYVGAYNDDGSLFFPERLTKEFLTKARRTMGPYLFANQYDNKIIPDGLQTFQRHWIRYYSNLPEDVHHFAYFDPAIGEADTADYTGIVVIATDAAQNWYVRYAKRHRLNPTELINMMFKIHKQYNCQAIGVEEVAFQKAIVHFAFEEMKRRKVHIPVTGVTIGTDKTKEMRILGLVPRMEWGSILFTQGLADLELEMSEFPRGAHDDVLDALASIENIVSYPSEPRRDNERPAQNHPTYEKWYLENVLTQRDRPGEALEDY